MKRSTNKTWYVLLLVLGIGVFFSACKKDEDDQPQPTVSKIPGDNQATPPPAIVNHIIDDYIPNLSVSTHNADANHIIIQMTGIKDPNSRSYIQLQGTGMANQNIWLQVDGKDKGFLVTKNSNSGGSAKLVDMVFTVDNSGSMDDEADTIAMQIKNWVHYLNTQNLNINVGIVGYDVSGNISGALNFTDAQTLEYYLVDREIGYYSDPVTGTDRTVGFYGADSATLHQYAQDYAPNIYDENGMVAVRFAHEYFAWRSGANRIYVNFTDEPNQTTNSSDSLFSVYSLINHWNATDGTIHTVYSEDTTGYWYDHNERPWLMSEYTGGQAVFVNDDATDLDLNALPVTGALAETFLVEYMNNEGAGVHNIQIFVKSNLSDADGTRLYKNVSYSK